MQLRYNLNANKMRLDSSKVNLDTTLMQLRCNLDTLILLFRLGAGWGGVVGVVEDKVGVGLSWVELGKKRKEWLK